MPDVFARLTERISSPAEPEFAQEWGEETIYEPQPVTATRIVEPSRGAFRSSAMSTARVHEAVLPAARELVEPEREAVARVSNSANAADLSSPATAVERPRSEPGSAPARTPAPVPERATPTTRSLEKVISLLQPGTEAPVVPSRAHERRPTPEPAAITVEIGQILVRPPAASPSPASAVERAPSAPVGTLSLSDYLAGRR